MSEKRDFTRENMPSMRMGGKGGPGGPGKGRFQEKVKPKNSIDTIKRLITYLANHKLKMILALIFALISSAFSILASYLIRPITNDLVDNAGSAQLVYYLVLMLIVYFVSVFCNYLQSRLMLSVAQNSLAKLREDLYNAMQKLPIKFFDKNKNGDLMSRFTNDVDIVNQMLSSTAISLVTGVFTLATTVAIMLYTNWILAVLTLLIAPLCSSLTKFISKKSMSFYKGQQASIGQLNGYVEERIDGQKVIKVFNHEEECIADFRELNDIQRDKSFNAQFLGGIMGPLMGFLAQASYVITACIGGILCATGRFDIGGFIIFLGYSKSFSRPVNEIFMQINSIYSALAGAERVFEVMNYEEEKETGDKKPEILGEVSFENVSFGYLKGQKVLKEINITAKKSQKVAFVGSTGAGKTTVTNLLNRFYDIQSGTIKIDDTDIMDMDKNYLRQNIATVLQDTHLFTGSIMENVRYGRLDASDEEVIEACKTANADSFIRKLENGYQTILKGDGANLSGGQRQLLNIARAAISKAPILVLDEATSSVDTRTERNIEQALDRLMSQRTTFVIAHRLSTVRNSDKIIVLDLGKIIESGTHEELLALKGKYFSLYTGAEKLD
ncbi:MAG: ABC transporter ATP-binding protein [Clostridia bacterium]